MQTAHDALRKSGTSIVYKLAPLFYARAFACSNLDLEIYGFCSFSQPLSASFPIRKLLVPQDVVKWNLDSTDGGSKAVNNCLPFHTESHARGLDDNFISVAVSAVDCSSEWRADKRTATFSDLTFGC
jgi:hypothetical protein